MNVSLTTELEKFVQDEVSKGLSQLERGEYTSYANAQALAAKIKRNGRQRKAKESKPA
jgi:hypothetical protein